MGNMDISIIKERTAALSTLGTGDLADQTKMAALVVTAHEINEQAKALKAEDTRVKDEFKRIVRPYTDEGKAVTVYSYDTGMKMATTLSGGALEIDEQKLLDNLYALYGEVPGDRTGRAWEAFVAISDPVEVVPRVVNPDKLAAELARSERILLGVESGEALLTRNVVQGATVQKPVVVSAKCSAMTKAEVKAHEMGELTDTMVVR